VPAKAEIAKSRAAAALALRADSQGRERESSRDLPMQITIERFLVAPGICALAFVAALRIDSAIGEEH
jgi:hypothetical protein